MSTEDRRVLVTGASGQVGKALAELIGARAVPLTRKELDLAEPGALPEQLARLEALQPTAVLNPAAYTQVDRAEAEEEQATAVNGAAPGVLARWCAARQIPFVHFSTDYVFPGSGDRPWTEEDPVGPLNAYGRSKAEGERQVREAGGRWLILRTSWVYDATGRNFLTTMLRLGRERETLRVVADQYGAPTYAPHLAEAALAALDRASALTGFPSGIYHLCHAGATTWHAFAQAIFGEARRRGCPLTVRSVEPIATCDYPTPAHRPANSRLDTGKIRRVLGIELPDWSAGLNECLQRLQNAPESRA